MKLSTLPVLKEKLKTVFIKKREVIYYLFFGVMTTMINFLSLWVFNVALGVNEIGANTLAWIVAVTFAFITNKYFVFGSKSTNFLLVLKEAFSFYSGRFLTLILDNLFIFVFVSVMDYNLFLIKCITEFMIIILNYIFGKIIFSKKNKTAE